MKYIKLVVSILILFTVYCLLTIYKPGLSNIPQDKQRDASAIFYTDIENINKYLND